MNKANNKIVTIFILIISSVAFTWLTKIIDVQPVGLNKTNIGFSEINQSFFNFTGVNMFWYHFTDWLGIIPILIALGYAILGISQWIKRKSILKVDREIIILGLFYLVVISLYIFFELYIVNYRPVLIDGFMESSYPSSHTLMTIFICGSSIIINKRLFNKVKIINTILMVIIVITVFGRLISGVHLLTEIIGGSIISATLLMFFDSALKLMPSNK